MKTELEKQQELALKKLELDGLQPISFTQLENTVKEWMIVPDPGVIKMLCALYVANKFTRKGVWMMLIAPSGGGKTELLNGLSFLPDIFELSSLTTTTFLSGLPGKGDASLLPKVSGKIVIMKDFTTMLAMQKEARAEIMSQLREIHDGKMRKVFGNNIVRTWEGKVSILAASTQAVDLHQQMFTYLGERFLNYRILMPDRKEVALRCLDNDSQQEEMVWEIQKAFYAFFKGIDWTKLEGLPELPPDVKVKLVDLADFCTMARSGVIRDQGPKQEVKFVPAAEMPTRIIQQLHTIASALMVVNKELGYQVADMEKIIYKIALDSIPQTNRMVILEMARANEQTTKEIALALDYPTAPIRLYLENLALLKVCHRVKGSDSADGGAADRWTLLPAFTEIVRKYEKISPLTEEEKDYRKKQEDTDEWQDLKTPEPEASIETSITMIQLSQNEDDQIVPESEV